MHTTTHDTGSEGTVRYFVLARAKHPVQDDRLYPRFQVSGRLRVAEPAAVFIHPCSGVSAP
jgi:hypothetical protein